MLEFFKLFAVQCFAYALITYNYRVIAQGNIAAAITSDVIFASTNFFIIRKIAKSEDSFVPWLGYVSGSACGTYLGIVASKILHGV